MAAPVTPSKAAQMRRAKAKNGLTTGEVGRLFGVSYHHAYQATVIHASSKDSAAAAPSEGDLKAMSETELFALHASSDKRDRAARIAAGEELDRRDPTADWTTRFAKWMARTGK